MFQSRNASFFNVTAAALVHLPLRSIMSFSYTPSQIDDANLNYHYKIIVNDARGIYYQLKSGAQGFPQGFWGSER
jgi:hypothetical protein